METSSFSQLNKKNEYLKDIAEQHRFSTWSDQILNILFSPVDLNCKPSHHILHKPLNLCLSFDAEKIPMKEKKYFQSISWIKVK